MSTSALRRLLALGLIVTFAIACDDDDKKKRSNHDSSTVTASTTTTEAGLDFRSTTGAGVTENPDNTFHIPACSGANKLGYITAPWTTPLPAGATMTVTFTVTASADAKIVGYEDHVADGRAALYFQRKNATKTAKKDPYALALKLYNQGYRQWSHAREMLTAGDHVFSVVLAQPKFTGGGSQTEANFAAALADPANVGITLSGAQSAGHGVCMTAGTASITIKSFTVG